MPQEFFREDSARLASMDFIVATLDHGTMHQVVVASSVDMFKVRLSRVIGGQVYPVVVLFGSRDKPVIYKPPFWGSDVVRVEYENLDPVDTASFYITVA